MSEGRSPPTSQESESLPSEKAPAPEKPVVMWQTGLQLMQTPVFAFGQRRCSSARPFSTMTIFFFEPRRNISSAVKIPAGPAPTMTTSAFMSLPPDIKRARLRVQDNRFHDKALA